MQAAASITPIGLMAKKLRAKKREAEKEKANQSQREGGGNIMRVKVIGGGAQGDKSGKSLVDKINDKKEAQGDNDALKKAGAAASIMKKGGSVKLKKKPKPFNKNGVKVSKYKNGGKTLEHEMLSGAGVMHDKRGANKLKGVFKVKEEQLYRGSNRKPPKRIII